jgi:hypothetical protein
MAKVEHAAKTLPGTYRIADINGLTKSGHLLIRSVGAVVNKGKYEPVAIPFTE